MSRKNQERYRRAERLRAGENVEHGRLGTYTNWMCRCGACKGAYMEWYSVYSSKRPPRRRQLPTELQSIADESSDELAQLIQEQYDDDAAVRVGYANRLPRYDSDSALGED